MNDLLHEVARFRRRGRPHPVALDLALSEAAQTQAAAILADTDTPDPYQAAIQWIAACDLAALGRRRSRQTRETEATTTAELGRAAQRILAAWPADGPPAPQAIRDAAHRQWLFEGRAEVESPRIGTPRGPVRVVARREPDSAVWRLALRDEETGRHWDATGYALVGILSGQSVRVVASPLYDHEGHYWGVEARMFARRRNDREEYAGAEWRATADGYAASALGVIDPAAPEAWPAIGPHRVRQGDVLLVSTRDVPPDPERGAWSLLRRVTVEGGQTWVDLDTGEWVEVTDPAGAVVIHPDHPSIRLSPGWWRAIRIAQPARPNVTD